jgi:predicted 2-oxoglutarate/Fe(II)-dependent dioxygenase YbiX
LVKQHLPQRFYQGTRAEVKLVELNERCRFLCYEKGDAFAAHCDGCYYRPPGHARAGDRSVVTVQLYLNDVPTAHGGATTFIGDSSGGLEAVQPRAGSVLVFTQDLYHEGSKLVKGLKFCLRTEAMYRRVHANAGLGHHAIA